MVIGVQADLMAFLVHAPHHVLVFLHLGADEEERGVHSALRQAVQQTGGGRAARPVVEGQGDELLPGLDRRGFLRVARKTRVRLHRRRMSRPQPRRRQNREQQKGEGQYVPLLLPSKLVHIRPPPFQIHRT